MRAPACFAVVLSLLAASCGGNVVVDTGGPTSMTSLALCEAACNALATTCTGNPAQECATSCAQIDPLFEKACPDAYQAYMTCAESNAKDLCGTMPATVCSAEMTAFEACYMQVCTTPTTCQ